MTDAKKTAKPAASYEGLAEDERAAMKERVRELKKAALRGGRGSKADGESDVRAKIAEMPEDDRVLAERIHAIVTATAPELAPKTWYGMPAYAKDGKVVCFFRAASKFKERYAILGFEAQANLDDGTMWPTVFALTALTPANEDRIAALVKQAVS